ncbi:unnamed protein product [Brachionus calyciflorus]|uniref:Phosphodiesterase n=1 Tax=Brachionus calyciflorus TaxID=104777 RepID=A0A813P8G7_9BILA|nr:unnamed protein product [Brachionus calyciflorus]
MNRSAHVTLNKQNNSTRSSYFKFDSIDLDTSASPLNSQLLHHHPIYLNGHQDELIVTPFAQVLASLKTVRQNFEKINNAPKDKNNKNQLVNSIAININENLSILDDDSTKLMKDTLDEIDWCLMQLERMQSFKSISDSATTKFRLLLNKELTQYGGTDQIKQFISETYLDQKEEIESRNNEGPMRQSGPHRSDSSINLNRNLDETQTDDLCNNTSRHNERLKSIDETNCKNSQKNRIYWKNIPQKSFDKCETVNESVELNPSIKKENRTPSNDSAKNAQIISANKRRSLIPSSDRILSSQLESSKKPINDINNPSNSTMNSIFLTRISNSLQKENIIDEQTGEYYTYGVKTSKPKELDDLMEDLDVWGLDIFLMDELTEHRPLTAVAFTIFKQRDLMNTFSICPSTLINYLIELEDHYQSVPYHCKIHAADVTQSMHVLLNHKALESVFDDDEIFAAIFSAAIHDVDHPGLTNQYLISTASELAIMYNDDSVLENHHLAVAFKLLQHEKRDIFCNIPKKKRQLIRTMVIDMVRATDMSKHMSLLAELKTMVETKKVAGSGIIELDSYQDRIRVLKNMLHCADLSNPTKPLDIYRKWTDRVMNEFFLQGDKESSQGLEISAMCDRHKACIEKTQVGFIDFIVHPLWESWADLVHPDAQDILESLQRNRDWYSEQVENLQALDKTNDKAQN